MCGSESIRTRKYDNINLTYIEMWFVVQYLRPKDQKERPPKEGSTRLPKFPAVRIAADDLGKKPLYYSDVPSLRYRENNSSCQQNVTRQGERVLRAGSWQI